jgi:hypothetical protein
VTPWKGQHKWFRVRSETFDHLTAAENYRYGSVTEEQAYNSPGHYGLVSVDESREIQRILLSIPKTVGTD